MLTLKELNDRSYKEIVESAAEMIPRIFPQWTDHRAHDPGITLVELFAWLAEMMEYYQNRVTYKNRLKFLKLLGISLKAPGLAQTDIAFENIKKNVPVPHGVRVFADGLTFETCRYLNLQPLEIVTVTVLERRRSYEVFRKGLRNKVGFYAFGENLNSGNSMCMGLCGNYTKGSLSVKIEISEAGWPRNKIESKESYLPVSRLRWEYLENSDESVWEELPVINDETYDLTFSGIIEFLLPETMEKGYLDTNTGEKLYYIRCVLLESGYEMPPNIKGITLNSTIVRHGRTMSRVYYFSGIEGNPESGLAVEMDGYLPYFGQCEVKVRDDNGYWILWDRVASPLEEKPGGRAYLFQRNPESMKTTLLFGTPAGGVMPPAGTSNIMVAAYDKAFSENRHIHFGRPLPNQVFRLDWAMYEDLIYPVDFKIQIGNRKPGEQDFRWLDFERAGDFFNSKGNDRHFILDYEKREIRFGNNEMGAMPPDFGENIIEIVQCTIGGGVKGNIKENRITHICEPFSKWYQVTNQCQASGGHEEETMEHAVGRMLTDMQRQYRGVTLTDYEEAVLSTPGLMAARAKAIPQYVRGQKDYPKTRSPGELSVVVVPYSTHERPMPGKAFIQKVKKHLEGLRLVTTELHVIPPEYVKLKVRCTIVVLPHIKFNEESVLSMLNEYISPIGGKNFSGWPFGGAVRKGDIISRISSIVGVEYVKDIQLYTDGEDIRYEKSGDIVIPPYALVYSDGHEVEIINGE
ncbi:MAG TPA: baseplate J/gp47 family protein [Ruminiclostridium sp.]|nr:baseplate J/gp47 family protein [Ruminiclostridium sp.]